MVTKMTVKHQLTIPKKILGEAGLSGLKDKEMYFEITVKGNEILLKPVRISVEEIIPEAQLQRFEAQVTKLEEGDEGFNSFQEAAEFLKKRIKK